jgi:hypothetical protein
MRGMCSTHARAEECIQYLTGKPKGKKRCRRRWDDNIRMDLGETWWRRCGVDVSGSRYGPMAGSCEHSNEPSGFIEGWEFID